MGILGSLLGGDLLGGLTGGVRRALTKSLAGLLDSAAGEEVARDIYKTISDVGNPKLLPAGVTATQRQAFVLATGRAVEARVRLVADAVRVHTDAQIVLEGVRGAPEEGAARAAREQAEAEIVRLMHNLVTSE